MLSSILVLHTKEFGQTVTPHSGVHGGSASSHVT